MNQNCGLLTAPILLDCDNPIVSGVSDRLILINKPDIVSINYGSSKEIISSITLGTSKTAFAIYGKNDSVDPKTEFARQRFSSNDNHEVSFRIFGNTVSIKQQLNKMSEGKYLAIVENNYRGSSDADSAFEVYGEIAGLELAERSRMPTDVESEGSWLSILRTPERSKEPRVPASFWDTNYATTKAAIDGML